MDTISVSAYEGTRRTLEKPLEVKGWDKARHDLTSTLVVDDILDSGDTLTAIRGLSRKAQLAVLVIKQEPIYHSMSYFARVPKKVWVQFPWEKDEDATHPKQ
jgi:hypoxanthine phosphoribosyltransferase